VYSAIRGHELEPSLVSGGAVAEHNEKRPCKLVLVGGGDAFVRLEEVESFIHMRESERLRKVLGGEIPFKTLKG